MCWSPAPSAKSFSFPEASARRPPRVPVRKLSVTILFVGRITLEKAYPGVAFHWRSRNWWARLTRVPPECVHLQHEATWMATYIPDTLFLRGKASVRRRPARPEVSLCRACLLAQLEVELAAHPGRIVAFEPDSSSFTQYFFVSTPDFAAAGLQPETATAISRRLGLPSGDCDACELPAAWLWISREEVANLDDVGHISMARGQSLCSRHGARRLCESLGGISEANLFYVNVPYGEAGAYLWI
jgi:hypothetical protein